MNNEFPSAKENETQIHRLGEAGRQFHAVDVDQTVLKTSASAL